MRIVLSDLYFQTIAYYIYIDRHILSLAVLYIQFSYILYTTHTMSLEMTIRKIYLHLRDQRYVCTLNAWLFIEYIHKVCDSESYYNT